MRAIVATCGAVVTLWALGAAQALAQSPAEQALQSALGQGIQRAGSSSGAYVVDLDTGQPLFSVRPGTGRLPASVEKIYTTSTALLRLGSAATLSTTVFGTGSLDPNG